MTELDEAIRRTSWLHGVDDMVAGGVRIGGRCCVRFEDDCGRHWGILRGRGEVEDRPDSPDQMSHCQACHGDDHQSSCRRAGPPVDRQDASILCNNRLKAELTEIDKRRLTSVRPVGQLIPPPPRPLALQPILELPLTAMGRSDHDRRRRRHSDRLLRARR